MKYRKLRIAWSVAWGLLAVLLVVLWVRSYIGNDDGADKVAPDVIAKLIELKFVELTTSDLPQLTDKGERAHVVLEPGDGNVPEFNDYPPAGE